jgi:hypothetical protein
MGPVLAPNPASDNTVLVWRPETTGIYELELVDGMGRVVQRTTIQGRTGSIERTNIVLAGIPPGIYSVVMRSKNGRSSTRLAVE